MGLAEQQRLLARLYTDARIRGEFQADPRRVGGEFGLSPAESDSLAERSGEQIRRFAQMLRAKRFGEIQDLLPATLAALGDETSRRLFQEFALGFAPRGIHKHREDAIAFAGHLATLANRPPAADRAIPDWIGDLARCEAANLDAPLSRRPDCPGGLGRLRGGRCR